MDKDTIIMFVIGFILFGALYIFYLTTDGIWIIFLIILTFLLIIIGIIKFIEKKYPESKILNFLTKLKEIIKELIP